MSKKKRHLLVIDPQEDFCSKTGALYVTGAEKDMANLGTLIERSGSNFDDIHVTLDSHPLLHIAHPFLWVDKDGKNPSPFTSIALADVTSNKWKMKLPQLQQRAFDYVSKLDAGKRYGLTIWPPHCLIGSRGHSVCQELFGALNQWCSKQNGFIHFVTKGSNPFTEHYSAVQAEVPDPKDPSTLLNMELIKILMEADEIIIAGEALDFCVANTLRDIANAFKDDSYVAKMVLLEDCSSSIIPPNGVAFLKEMKARGMKTIASKDYL